MVERITIHFEGDGRLKPGFRKLFERHADRARGNRIRFKVVAGGSNAETVKDFLMSCRRNPSDLNVLLVDSEAPAPNAADAIQQLRSRGYWEDANAAVNDGQINFMVQAMEAWFIADPRALARHFGNRFNADGLPSPRNAESISPKDLTDSIDQALRAVGGRRRRKYDKARDGARLLELLDETTVRQNCPNFGRLMDFLSSGF